MTKAKAVEVARALNDIEDFARFMEEVEKLYHESEGDLANFIIIKCYPQWKQSLHDANQFLNKCKKRKGK